MRTLLVAGFLAGLIGLTGPAAAQSIVTEGEGWQVRPTQKDYETLLTDLKAAVKANEMGLVTEAGPTGMAKQRGFTIAGNRVVGVFRNDFAVTLIEAAPAAMIEPPIRFMVMEEPDGTATLAYVEPSVVLAPYAQEGGDTVTQMGDELDTIFAAIAEAAVAE